MLAKLFLLAFFLQMATAALPRHYYSNTEANVPQYVYVHPETSPGIIPGLTQSILQVPIGIARSLQTTLGR